MNYTVKDSITIRFKDVTVGAFFWYEGNLCLKIRDEYDGSINVFNCDLNIIDGYEPDTRVYVAHINVEVER